MTGGLSQIAPPPPPPRQEEEQDKDSLQDEEEDVTGLAEQKGLQAVIIEEEEADEEAPAKGLMHSARSGDGEVKVTVHNKQLLMDVLMGAGEEKKEVKKPPAKVGISSLGGVQRVPKVQPPKETPTLPKTTVEPIQPKTYASMK